MAGKPKASNRIRRRHHDRLSTWKLGERRLPTMKLKLKPTKRKKKLLTKKMLKPLMPKKGGWQY
jgi:hypothetical protein